MGHRRSRLRGPLATVLVGTLLLVACSSGGDADDGAADSVAAVADGGVDGDDTNAARVEGEIAAPQPVSNQVAIQPESEIPTNLFPDLVVDDLTSDTKVNLRNIVPNELPILLWMWAPW